MKIAFGMIVCNGGEFLKECIECIYPFADHICIAEGATQKWADAHGWTSPRSTDDTINIIKQFPDVDDKIRLVQSPRPYRDKNHQSNRWVKEVSGDVDYVWMVDCDELYLSEDLEKIKKFLESNPTVTTVSIPLFHFFKNIHTIACGGSGWGWDVSVPRIFSYKPGRMFKTHRPPTILDESGRDLASINYVDARDLDVWIRHYSYVTNTQVLEKMKYYQKVFGYPYVDNWYRRVWMRWDRNRKEVERKFSTHPTEPGGKTKCFTGTHPLPILKKYNLQ